MHQTGPDVTGLLVAVSNGDDGARTRLIEAVYQFFAIAAHLMRRILVDHARAHHALKRGAGERVPLDDVDAPSPPLDVDVLALDTALNELAARYPRQGQLVELRFFGGLTVEEVAVVLDVSPITVKRDWALAKTWLYREVRGLKV